MDRMIAKEGLGGGHAPDLGQREGIGTLIVEQGADLGSLSRVILDEENGLDRCITQRRSLLQLHFE